MKKRKLGVPKMGKSKIDYKAVEKHGSMGKFDMFERGRGEVKRMSKKYKKGHGRKPFKWNI